MGFITRSVKMSYDILKQSSCKVKMSTPSLSWHTINIHQQEDDNKYPEIPTAANTGKL